MKLSRYEQETVVNYNAGEQTATLYTRDKAVMRKLDTLVADFPDTYKPRAVSTEQREQARQMMIERNKGKNIKDFFIETLLYKFLTKSAV